MFEKISLAEFRRQMKPGVMCASAIAYTEARAIEEAEWLKKITPLREIIKNTSYEMQITRADDGRISYLTYNKGAKAFKYDDNTFVVFEPSNIIAGEDGTYMIYRKADTNTKGDK